MANTYSWAFSSLDIECGPDAEGHTDVVYTIHWRYSATDGEDPPHRASSIGTSSVKWEEGEPWIPYEDLTEADIQGWVEADLGEEQIADMQATFDAQIAEKVNPTHESKRVMPWDEDNGA